MLKRLISFCLVFTIALSLLLVPAYAYDAPAHTSEEITIHIPAKSTVVVPRGWVDSGSVIRYPIGNLTALTWIYITVTSNSAGIPVIFQLYTEDGAGYLSKTVTFGSAGWQVGVSAYHELLITNDNNYGTDVSFYFSYY